MKVKEIVGWYFLIAFFIWAVMGGAYGAGHTDYPQTPLYNTPEQEARVGLVYMPIFALLWPLWAVIYYGLFEWLPRQFQKK